jgi:hypothetical protein
MKLLKLISSILLIFLSHFSNSQTVHRVRVHQKVWGNYAASLIWGFRYHRTKSSGLVSAPLRRFQRWYDSLRSDMPQSMLAVIDLKVIPFWSIFFKLKGTRLLLWNCGSFATHSKHKFKAIYSPLSRWKEDQCGVNLFVIYFVLHRVIHAAFC